MSLWEMQDAALAVKKELYGVHDQRGARQEFADAQTEDTKVGNLHWQLIEKIGEAAALAAAITTSIDTRTKRLSSASQHAAGAKQAGQVFDSANANMLTWALDRSASSTKSASGLSAQVAADFNGKLEPFLAAVRELQNANSPEIGTQLGDAAGNVDHAHREMVSYEPRLY